MVGVVFDVTDRREAFAALTESERRQRLLIDELNHRVKNTLATVQSVARQTAKSAGTMDEFRATFEARLLALSNTHNALTRGRWERASLRELLDQEFQPYPQEQVRLVGPDVDLSPRQALSLGMVIHELATNAAKYGALSRPGGVVTVQALIGARGEAGQLTLLWTEEGGPATVRPSRMGFGSRLVQASARELGGEAELSFDAEGLVCRLCVPLEEGAFEVSAWLPRRDAAED
jgi:two-component sensor histidine kinase